jgi:tripeptide aminopeptidase
VLHIRGGTVGAGCPVKGPPALSVTGGYNFHGRKELITVQAMEKMTDVLVYLTQNA